MVRDFLAHVQFRAPIRERSVEPYIRLLKELGGRRRVRGVLFDVSSGGGGDIPSTDLYLAVKRLDKVKPVIATIGSIGASGAYMAAVGARKVYAYPDSIVGSIGVVFPHLAVGKLLEKLGVEVELLHQGRHKDAFQGLRPLTDEERQKVLAVAADSYSSFVDLVARERHRSVEEIRALATGEFWSGRQALKLGLVDALGDREEALEELSRATGVAAGKVRRVGPPRSFFERLSGATMQIAGESIRQGLHDAVEELLVDAAFGRFR